MPQNDSRIANLHYYITYYVDPSLAQTEHARLHPPAIPRDKD